MKTLLVLAFIGAPALAPSVADAQPGYYNGQPPSSQHPGGFHNRTGRLAFGFSLGLGGMSDSGGDIECANCNALSGQASGHIGGFLGPRFALLFEIQANVQTIEQGQFVEDDLLLTQSALMGAIQYWVTPQLWVKGGLGVAHLSLDDAYYTSDIDNGLALLGAVGFELMSARNFSVDLQGRLIAGSYDGIDNQITAGSVGVGINWF